jgi:glycosyltransferase involved in cell wall biosynthesis
MNPLVSILIPAFNSEKWIAATIRSAVAQTWPRKEIIVVDDGSVDRTVAVAQRFESRGVRVVSQKQQGASSARNHAFALSRGDYIQWLDADDLLAPDKIARQMEVAAQCRSRRTLLSGAWAYFAFRYYRAKFVPTALWRDLPPNEWLLSKMGQNLFMQTATWLVSRELTEAAGPWDSNITNDDDGEYFCRVLLQSDGVRFVPESRVYYRRVHGARTLSYLGPSSPKLDSQFRSMQLHIGCLRSLEDSERVRAACVTYIQNWLFYFYPERLDLVDRLREMARGLGGQLEEPRLSWKYAWIKTIFGWRLARRAEFFLPRIRGVMQRCWDKALFRLDIRSHAVDPQHGSL